MSSQLKILIVTDSAGNPRSFPASEIVHLEETFPYLIRKHFPEAIFWQLSFGSLSTSKLLSQPMGYLTHWAPDIIIVQSGMQDCHPVGLTDFEMAVLKHLTWKFFPKALKYLNRPSLVKFRNTSRVTKGAFRKTVRQFKMVFSNSKIFWVGIGADTKSEKSWPGLNNKMEEFNAILEEVYKNDFVRIQQLFTNIQGFNSQDHMHWNKKGHLAVAGILLKAMESYLQELRRK